MSNLKRAEKENACLREQNIRLRLENRELRKEQEWLQRQLNNGTKMTEPFVLNDKVSYSFNDEGKLVNIENGEGFVFTNQDDYERLGREYVEGYIFNLMIKDPYNLRRVLLNGKDVTNTSRSEGPADESFVFISENFYEAPVVAVIIHGTGVVRAGQWSRKLIVNESLEVGSQLPYIKQCHKREWGILVTNTNDTFYVNDAGKKVAKKGSATSIEHGINAWKQFIDSNTQASKIVIIAHSYGGKVTMNILRSTTLNTDRISVICMTDGMFDDEILTKTYAAYRNWVRSERPLDEEVSGGNGKYVSAGTPEHERTSHTAINSVFQFIDRNLASNEKN